MELKVARRGIKNLRNEGQRQRPPPSYIIIIYEVQWKRDHTDFQVNKFLVILVELPTSVGTRFPATNTRLWWLGDITLITAAEGENDGRGVPRQDQRTGGPEDRGTRGPPPPL